MPPGRAASRKIHAAHRTIGADTGTPVDAGTTQVQCKFTGKFNKLTILLEPPDQTEGTSPYGGELSRLVRLLGSAAVIS